jgi:hypothetical protein
MIENSIPRNVLIFDLFLNVKPNLPVWRNFTNQVPVLGLYHGRFVANYF